jgi:hypothetical protein
MDIILVASAARDGNWDLFAAGLALLRTVLVEVEIRERGVDEGVEGGG